MKEGGVAKRGQTVSGCPADNLNRTSKAFGWIIADPVFQGVRGVGWGDRRYDRTRHLPRGEGL